MNIYNLKNFASFFIHPLTSKNNTDSSNKTAGRWVGEHEAMVIHGRSIKRGFYYFGGQLETLIGYGNEPSMIDDSLPVAPPQVIHRNTQIDSDDTLGYWPRYATLSAKCRGAYLDWLASDRTHPQTPIGYVFIYFAGIERRIIENINNEVVSDAEFIAIYTEVMRLYVIYGEHYSFGKYTADFLEFMRLARSLLFEDTSLIAHLPDAPVPTNNANLSFKLDLAKTVALGKPISAKLAWQWLNFADNYNFKTPAKRCATEFKKLFNIYYKQSFADGMVVKPNKTRLKISYHASSRSIMTVDLTLDDLPDPTRLTAPVNKLVEIAEKSNDALDAYSRYVGRESNCADDVSALMLLPKILVEQQNPAIIQKFKAWATQVIDADEGLTTVKALWEHLDTPLPKGSENKALNKKQNELLINLAELSGFGIVPDQRYYRSKLKFDDYVVLFAGGHQYNSQADSDSQVDNGENTGDNDSNGEFIASDCFYQVKLALRLGAMVATIDGHVYKSEIDVLLALIESNHTLSTTEKKSLTAYLLWQLNTPANMTGLKAKLATLDDSQMAFISQVIISVALANGSVKPEQIKQIEKLYHALGLDKSRVTSDIHHVTTRKKTAQKIGKRLVDVQDNKASGTQSSDNTLSFDADVLAMLESETGEAKAMLASIFADDKEVDDTVDNQSVENQSLESQSVNSQDKLSSDAVASDDQYQDQNAKDEPPLFAGLDRAHGQLYQQLIIKEAWTQQEVMALCQSLELMINGAIETINDWAFEVVGAPVLEEDDTIIVDLEIVAEITDEL
ncbi:tellurite resistance TerB family protein [Psychrobacter sp. I-STPA10]|uniref:tellurite resistance TerB family protein n=1 Tax=Psychrobacter sp. I-STPA10 TaxID=2585769 RepID=UPI001E28A76D|nr:TerB N-terminal domain-containing protein [Psychrobacter sp. I-STPA10]